MSKTIRQFTVIARAAATEILRQPSVLLLFLAFYWATTLTPLFQVFRFGEPGRMVRDGGLAFMLLSGMALSVCAAATTVRRELAGGSAATALSRPLQRGVFIAGKSAGASAALCVFAYCALLTVLLSERVSERFYFEADTVGHFMDLRLAAALLALPLPALLMAALVHLKRHSHFAVNGIVAMQTGLTLLLLASGFFRPTGQWQTRFAPNLSWPLAGAVWLVLLALFMLAAMATALAIFSDFGGVLAVCAGITGLGLVADTLPGSGTTLNLLSTATAIVPNLQHLWLCDALAGGAYIPLSYLLQATIYAGLWSVLALVLAALFFRYREIEY